MEQAKTKNYDVIVIGGGASGMMSAITAAENGSHVLLLEKNKRLGEKLRISGGGRCNITNAEEDMRTLLKSYGTAEKYLYSAFSKYSVQNTMQFFEKNKLPLKVEAKKRVFPVSDNAADVVHVLTNRLHRLGVEMQRGTEVTRVTHKNSRITGIACGTEQFTAKNYILATGGLSRPETGSTGDGFDWLRNLGHTVRAPSPSITPLALKNIWIKNAAGTIAKDASITFEQNSKKAFTVKGDILFTHFGISGPTVLNSANKVGELLENDSVAGYIDFFPDIDTKTLDNNVIVALNQNGTRLFKNILPIIIGVGLSPAIRAILQDDMLLQTKGCEISKLSRKKIVDTIKHLSIEVEGLMGFEKAVVADGGVSLKEIDTRTMKSTIVENLYITGDLLDINRPSGGYSLQLCWTTGYIAGLCAS